ncbi:hypothetical protein JCM10135_11550 [Stetteria hydrogenophila]
MPAQEAAIRPTEAFQPRMSLKRATTGTTRATTAMVESRSFRRASSLSTGHPTGASRGLGHISLLQRAPRRGVLEERLQAAGAQLHLNYPPVKG